MPLVLSVVASYLLGSVSSAWIVVRLFGQQDMRSEPDGTISAAAVYYKLGAFPYALAVLMDITFAATAVILARALTHSTSIAMLCGLAAMAGHNWSIFLRFKGGLGATAMAGALAAVMLWPLCYGLVAAALAGIITHRHGFGTAVGVLTVFFVALIQNGAGAAAVYPLSLFSLMLIKRFQLARAAGQNMLGSAK
ncbi:MAG: glycerol-3-phosphate acyltransferase [Dehalococcoidales bacterium]|jgi:glycerol-3-phosphate acyltransferase PlsY